MLFQISALSALGSGVADGCVFGMDSVTGAGSCDAGSGAGAGVSAWVGSLAGVGSGDAAVGVFGLGVGFMVGCGAGLTFGVVAGAGAIYVGTVTGILCGINASKSLAFG